MIAFLLHCVLYALSFMLAAKIIPGISVKSFGSAVIFSAVFAILDLLFFRILAFLTFPLVLVTLGIFLLFIRAGLFLAADKFVDGVHIDGFLAALLGSLLTGAINWLITRFVNF